MIHKNSKKSKTAVVMMVAIAALVMAAMIPGLIVADESHAATTEIDIVPGMRYTFTPTYTEGLTVTTTILKQGLGTETGGTWGTVTSGKLTVNVPSSATPGTTYNLTLRGTSSNPTQTLDTVISFKILGNMTVGGSQANIVAGGSVDMTPTFSGFGTPFTWAKTDGKTNPAGLTVNPTTGKVTGNPTGIGLQTVYITATSIYGETADLIFTFTIVPAIGMTNDPSTGVLFWTG